MLSSTPRFILKADGETIKTTTIPHPNTEPDLRADVEFKLGEEYVFEPREHVLKVSSIFFLYFYLGSYCGTF